MKQLKIKIKDRQTKITISKKRITYLAKQILRIEGIRQAELSILFTGKSHIRTLNKRFRKIDRSTDVLAFSMREGKDAHLHPEILGDVVICPEIAHQRAKTYNTTKEAEIRLYLIHGILHLLGHNDLTAQCRRRMQKEQARILKKITNHEKAKYF